MCVHTGARARTSLTGSGQVPGYTSFLNSPGRRCGHWRPFFPHLVGFSNEAPPGPGPPSLGDLQVRVPLLRGGGDAPHRAPRWPTGARPQGPLPLCLQGRPRVLARSSLSICPGGALPVLRIFEFLLFKEPRFVSSVFYFVCFDSSLFPSVCFEFCRLFNTQGEGSRC